MAVAAVCFLVLVGRQKRMARQPGQWRIQKIVLWGRGQSGGLGAVPHVDAETKPPEAELLINSA